MLLAGVQESARTRCLSRSCTASARTISRKPRRRTSWGSGAIYLCAVVLRISEARDLGEFDQLQVLRKNENDLCRPAAHAQNQHQIQTAVLRRQCLRLFHHDQSLFDGLFMPADDAGTMCATEITAAEVTGGDENFWTDFWGWYHAGGLADVVAYLAAFDLKAAKFDPKAPPKKTEGFWTMVGAGANSEVPELADVLDRIGAKQTPPATVMVDSKPAPTGPAAVTVEMVLSEL